jgi:hypothetical protein
MEQGAGTEYQRFQPDGPRGDKMKLVVGEEKDANQPERKYKYVEIDPWDVNAKIPEAAVRDWNGVRRVEHEEMLDNKTYIGARQDQNRNGEMIDNYRGNRDNTTRPARADEYYDAKTDKAYRHLPIEDTNRRKENTPSQAKNQRPKNWTAPPDFNNGWAPKGGSTPCK